MPAEPPADESLFPARPGWAHLRLRRRRNLGKALRGGLLIGTFALCAYANHRVGLGWWESVFAALQSFTLGLDIPAPEAGMAAGGPWPVAVWLTRLGAPLVAAESVLFVALVSGVIGRPRFLLVDHVVVVGAGSLGRSITEHLLDRDAADGTMLEVVAVDVDALGSNLRELEEQGAWTVVGDGTLPAVQHEARVEAARAVILATDSDVANVSALWTARHRCLRGARVYAHVTDAHLRGTVARAVAGDRAVEVFDLYDEAARILVAREGLDQPGDTPVVIAGFGRLGRAIHGHLRIDRCLVVDRDPAVVLPVRSAGDRQLASAVEGPEVVERIVAFVRHGGADRVVVFVSTDQDVRNLDLALALSDRLGAAGLAIRLVTRMAQPPNGDGEILRRIGATSLSRVVAASDRFRAVVEHRRTGLRARLVWLFAMISWWTGAV